MIRCPKNFNGHKRGFIHRRGFTYLLVTSFFVVVLLGVFFTTSAYKYQDQESMQQIRIRAMNDFVRNLNTDVHRAAYISAFRAMLALEDHVSTTGQYLTDINSSFRETFFYGTINGTSSLIMQNSTFNDYLYKVRQLASSTGITLDMNVTSIRMMQEDPWDIDVYILMNITAVDNKNTASWNINKEYLTSIPIDNLRDPIYSKNTFNRVPNVVHKLNASALVNGTNTSNLQKHIEGSYYLASPYAPNFVMRFEGNTNPDPNGIESIVDVNALASASFEGDILVDQNKIKIDYIYFNTANTSLTKVCNVQNIPSGDYFVISSDRPDLYQITGLNYTNSTCP